MEPISIENMKLIELRILEYIDKICKENNIKYSLAGGTLLGAVRHGGFIPWDDDIDIILIRPEYDRLIDILIKNQEYTLVIPETEGYWHPFAKLIDPNTIMVMKDKHETNIPNLGVFVDIFAADGCPDSKEEQIKYQAELRKELIDLRMSFFRCYNSSGKWWKRLIKKVIYFPKFVYLNITDSPENRKRKLLSDMKRYDSGKQKFAGFLLSVYDNEIFPSEYFWETSDIEFEGKTFQGLLHYDEYLTALYKDYMKLPPIEKRISIHNYAAYYR